MKRSFVMMMLWCLTFALPGCSGGEDVRECGPASCSGHGTCSYEDGQMSCDCDEGYVGATCASCASGFQDHDGDGSCEPSCAQAGLECPDHAHCDDTGGTASCVCDLGYAGLDCADCDAGYQDHDGDSACLPDCNTAVIDCGELGHCDDSSGVAKCDCIEGYQDNDADGSCRPDCSFALLDCGPHGHCEDASGAAECVCDEAYAGDGCGECAEGYQDRDGDGECLPGCAMGTLDCGEHGRCADSSGEVHCVCDAGYTGPECLECDTGFQDHDEDGTCLPDCELAALGCEPGGVCEDAGGEAVCICDPAYTGADCGTCAGGYQDRDADGLCLPDCDTAGIECGDHGSCSDASGMARCVCDEGYLGQDCSSCDEPGGWQDHDGDGECLPGCGLTTCEGHAHCEDGSGQAVCICDSGYTGAGCSECADGYQDENGDGSCEPTCATAGLQCGEHGTCVISAAGRPICECQTGYTGSSCQLCAAGYQDHDGDGICAADCSTAGLGCSGHSHCDDSSGEAECVCDTGYQGLPDCASCADGYQDSDVNGSCLPSCELLGWTCSGHGSCGYEEGQAVCFCDEAGGYFPDGQGHCLAEDVGHTCLLPMVLDLSSPTHTGSTLGTGDDYVGTCQTWESSQEVVYTFHLEEALTIGFDLSGSSYDTVMYLRTDCTDPASELACDDDSGQGLGSYFEIDLQPGEYYLFIDGYGSNAGSYLLTLDVGCPYGTLYDPASGDCVPDPCVPNPCSGQNQTVCNPVLPDSHVCSCDPGYIMDAGACVPDPNPDGEACHSVIPLQGSEGTVADSTVGAANDATGSCAGDGPDRVYGFTLPERARVEISMEGYDTVLHLRSACDSLASELACDDDGGPGLGSHFVIDLEAGAYYVWADSFSSAGDYLLTYSFQPDPCADEEAVCPGTPICQPSPDWSSYDCVCDDGYLPYEQTCVLDPCDLPDLCTEIEHKNRCVPDLPDNYHCECNIGYVPDVVDPEQCMEDPNANEWAFFTFLNADNNLEDDGYDDVNEQTQAGSNAYVHIVTLLDSYSRDNGDARILYIEHGRYTVEENWHEVDMSDWRTLRDFGVWAVQHYRARHYAFIMWDHGAGWKASVPKSPVLKGFSNDDHGSAGEISISNGDYARAMQGIVDELGDKMDIVGFDACLMGMWEVAEASAPFSHYLVASSETEPAAGWPYHRFLPDLVADHMMSAETLGIGIIDAYYNEATSNDTLALTDLDTLDDLAAAMDVFAQALLDNPQTYATLDSIRSSTQDFYYWEHRDLQDFAERVARSSSLPQEIRDAADALVAQLQVSIVYSRAHSGHPGSNGLAIYFPSRSDTLDSAYRASGAVWTRTLWDDFLVSFTR
ncbi:MAG: hypothetical protein JXR96_10615 [Deltaproteobacteria bacterium]|nr:hypothetical protein [Deltaproteobacteria bacterium]